MSASAQSVSTARDDTASPALDGTAPAVNGALNLPVDVDVDPAMTTRDVSEPTRDVSDAAAATSTPAATPTTLPAPPPPSQQPQTRESGSSASSHNNNNAATAAAAAASSTASPYGTRSRNRTGASRINYAEDKETDMDFEYHAPKDDEPQKNTRASAAAAAAAAAAASTATSTEPTTRSASSARRAPAAAADDTASHALSKEHIPGTSSFAVTASQPPSKKRKAGPNGHTNPPAASGRRASTAAVTHHTPLGDTNLFSFDKTGARLDEHGMLTTDDGTVLAVNDHVYLVCEPPGEPYYLGRIMEFLHVNNRPTEPVDALRINWYYRPRDIGRKIQDTRQIFASMHSDVSPLAALRGKCHIQHKSDFDSVDDLRRIRDSFWYEKLYDRYMHRYYDVIPTHQVVNVPANVKTVLHERWKYILVEQGRGKELTSAVKTCKRCTGYCASHDSVDCAVCQQTYHMNCVRPPLLKKPSRGFAWACGPCSRAQERKLEARNTPHMADADADDDEDVLDEDDDDGVVPDDADTGSSTPSKDADSSPAIRPATAEQIQQASLWPYRYLGIHCKVEDALDYDDRIYPRSSSRLGPRHQAVVAPWYGQPVQLMKPVEVKRRYVKGSGGWKGQPKLSKEAQAHIDAQKAAREHLPKWHQDEPFGYVPRGESYDNDDERCTAYLQFRLPEVGELSIDPARGEDDQPACHDAAAREQLIDDYMARATKLAKPIGVPAYAVNFLDMAVKLLVDHKYDVEAALAHLATMDKRALKEPELTPAEVRRFEDGVNKYGSELLYVKKHVKSVPYYHINRFYYIWKKTERGKQIWGGYSGRKGKKEVTKVEIVSRDEVADDHDDSAFDSEKALLKKRGFQCRFCHTRASRQWRRAPNTPAGTMITLDGNGKNGKDKGVQVVVALCRRCAELWRRYAIQWEDMDEVAKKVAQGGGRAWKRRIDEELLKELQSTNDPPPLPPSRLEATDSGSATPVPQAPAVSEPPKKRQKGTHTADKEVPVDVPAKKKAEKAVNPPASPEMPPPRTLPCAVCAQLEPVGEQHLTCKECRMAVHRNCYGVMGEVRGKWTCDMCANDKNPQVSISYRCMLCPIERTEHDFVDPPKLSRKKADKEKDRVERENAQKVADFYRKKQEELHRPVNPREPLKRTANNNWVHVTCAIWTPEVKFGVAKALQPSEGIPMIASARYDDVCQVCSTNRGACVACHTCRAPMHVSCAQQADCVLGFDVAPVKGSRRDQFHVVNVNGEVGTMTALIWCKEHAPTKTIVYRMSDVVDDTGLNALQLYVQNYKQADLTLTGTVRKATLVNQSTKATTPHRRASTNPTGANGHRGSLKDEPEMPPSRASSEKENVKVCVTCSTDVSPKWWPYPSKSAVVTIKTEASGLGSPLVLNALRDPDVPLAHTAANDKASSEPPTEYQCHKCHWNKKVLREPSPPPAPRVLAPEPPRAVIAPPPPVLSPPAVSVPQPSPYFSSSYRPGSPYGEWSRPASSLSNPTPRMSLQELVSPRPPNPILAPPSGPPRPPSVELPRSPLQNGHINQPSSSNAYQPPIHHSTLGGRDLMHNGTYGGYQSRPPPPPPQHLTNGGPPPRASESPFSNGHAMNHSRPAPYGMHGTPPPHGLHGSPPIRDATMTPNRDSNLPSSGASHRDNRVNGGASASPSLRNLLS